MNKKSIKTNHINTISWLNDTIVDWTSAGKQFTLEGIESQLYHYSFGGDFDGSITSDCGEYAFIYQKLGTKGLLLKKGEILREINRSYYEASTYEYPVAFATLNNGKTYLIHCPAEYCRIDFEDVETGEIVTNNSNRKPSDFFHSRFEVCAENKYLLSKGWYWHPWDCIKAFDLEKCLVDHLLLDNSKLYPDVLTEICTASFITSTKVLIASSEEPPNDDEIPEEELTLPPNHVAIWDIETNQLSKPVKPDCQFGNLFAINDTLAWDTFDFPKIIDIKTGNVISKDESISSSKQKSSIIHHIENIPSIAFNKTSKRLAITNKNTLEILNWNN